MAGPQTSQNKHRSYKDSAGLASTEIFAISWTSIETVLGHFPHRKTTAKGVLLGATQDLLSFFHCSLEQTNFTPVSLPRAFFSLLQCHFLINS